eukprot:5666427-Amphidinium_carterae.1
MEASPQRASAPRRKQVSTRKHYAQKLLNSGEVPQVMWLLVRRCLQQGLNPCQILELHPVVVELPPFDMLGCTWMWMGVVAGYVHGGVYWRE